MSEGEAEEIIQNFMQRIIRIYADMRDLNIRSTTFLITVSEEIQINQT